MDATDFIFINRMSIDLTEVDRLFLIVNNSIAASDDGGESVRQRQNSFRGYAIPVLATDWMLSIDSAGQSLENEEAKRKIFATPRVLDFALFTKPAIGFILLSRKGASTDR
jgi:hypothetical protein